MGHDLQHGPFGPWPRLLTFAGPQRWEDFRAGMVEADSVTMTSVEALLGRTNFSGMGREDGVGGIRAHLDFDLAKAVW